MLSANRLTADAAVVLLQHGGLTDLSGKTGLAFLRYRQGPIVAVLDPAHAGADLPLLTGIPRPVPVLGSVAEAMVYGPQVAVVGLAPSGGQLPEALRQAVGEALQAGLSVASGLHTRLGDDPALAALVQPGRWIWDLRQEPAALQVAAARAAALPCRRILALGTDMSVGKMSAALELTAVARQRGLDARFVATGQAGILIAGQGIALDAVRVDYAAGAVEQAVLTTAEGAGPEALLFVEGQGSFCHPGSSASLPLLRGSQPTGLLLVHRAQQQSIRNLPAVAIPPLPQLIATCEALAALAIPSGARAPRVEAIALNTALLSAAEAEVAIAKTAALTGLACADAVRGGAGTLLEALLANP
ncbi:MAG: DUF1611 domain-containing protein [Synechococcus lacustris]